MKKSVLVFLLFVMVSLMNFSSKAQNWQNICAPGTTFFSDSSGKMMAFRPDTLTISANNDTTFHSYPTLRDTMAVNVCIDTLHGSVLGSRVIHTHDGWFFFFNRNNDTIHINSNAATGQWWRFCNLTSSGYIAATVTSVASESVLGQPDQVRTVTLQAKTQAGVNISHPLNGKTFKLSQHYGLVSFFDVYFLPERADIFSLSGKTTPPLGLQDFEWRDIFDFSIGDEYHYQGYGSNMGGGATWKKIMTVINRTTYGNNDSVEYVMQRCTRTDGAPPPTTFSRIDTITLKYNFTNFETSFNIKALPEELIRNDWMFPGSSANKYSRRSGEFNGRQVKAYEVDYYGFGYMLLDCWAVALWEYWSTSEYAAGLGCTLYHTMEMYFQNSESLVYFARGGETWGTPVAPTCEILVGLPGNPEKTEIRAKVFPNPAPDRITVVTGNESNRVNFKFSISDLCGKEVLSRNIIESSSVIDITPLKEGLYLWQLTGGNGIQTGKLLVAKH